MAVLVWTKPEPGEGASPVKRRGVTLAVLTAYPWCERVPMMEEVSQYMTFTQPT